MKKVCVVLIALVLVLADVSCGYASASFDCNVFINGEYFCADDGSRFATIDQVHLTCRNRSDTFGFIVFGATSDIIIDGTCYLPEMMFGVAQPVWSGEALGPFENIYFSLQFDPIDWQDRPGKTLYYEYLPWFDPVLRTTPVEDSGLFGSVVYDIFIGRTMKDVILYAPVLQRFTIIVYTESGDTLEFEVPIVDFCNAFNAFWDDYSRAGGFTGDELRVIDFFAPIYQLDI